MPGPADGRLRRQVDPLRREFLQEGELPFADVRSAGSLAEAPAEIRRPWKDRIFPPLVPPGSSSARWSTPTRPAAPPSPA